MDKIVIAGYGFIGQELGRLFNKDEFQVYDPPQGLGLEIGSQLQDICFICVPTPQSKTGECDFSIVLNTPKRVKAKVYVCLSTIPPDVKLPKNMVCQPEYSASCSPYPAPLANIKDRNFIILGGLPKYTKIVRKFYESIYQPTTKIMETDSKTARIIKYMENSFIATYVSFCNEFYDICKLNKVDYDKVRDGLLLDPRMIPWWTYVYKNKRGWRGDCLPKDTAAIVYSCEKQGYTPELIKAVRKQNENIISSKL